MADRRKRRTRRVSQAMVVAMSVASAPTLLAQDRLPPIPPERMTDSQKKAVDEYAAARGDKISGPFLAMLRSPEAMSRARAMGDYLRYKTSLPPRLSEFVIIMTARQWTQQYEWGVHQPIALKAGVSPDTVAAIADGRRPDRLTEDEAILYDFCQELGRLQSVSDATFARAVARFGEPGVIDIVSMVGYYTLLAMVLNTARTPAPAGPAPSLVPFPK